MLKNKAIAVVIPAFNEETKIGHVIEAMPDFVDNVIVVDDGSSDATKEIAMEKGAIVVTHNRNKGVGAAFQSGVKKALDIKTDIMVNIDADGQFNPDDIEKLIQPIIDNKADFVTASRFMDPAFYPKMSRVKFWGNKFMSRFISKITGQRFFDVSCGFRAYSRQTLQRLNLFGQVTYTQETFIDLVYKNLTIMEVPVHVRGRREHGKSKVASNLFRYAYQTLKIILRTFRDYKPFRLFGYMSFFSLLFGLGFGAFLLVHYIQTGNFSPHKWAGFTSGFFLLVSVVFLMIGFILDMFARMRHNQEELLFELKKARGKQDE